MKKAYKKYVSKCTKIAELPLTYKQFTADVISGAININNIMQCGSCEKTFKKLKDGSCPHCGSGNWVHGYIDD